MHLPTQAEWEYAWYKNNSRGQTHPVGQKRPNAWGLYDMHGNVWEWVADRYAADYYPNSPRENPMGPDAGNRRLLRGASWRNDGIYCRSAFRHLNSPPRGHDHGFRAVVSSASPGVSASAREHLEHLLTASAIISFRPARLRADKVNIHSL